MAANLPGATRGKSTYKFEGDEIANLRVSPQIGRFEELNEAHVQDLVLKISRQGQRVPVHVRKAADGNPEMTAGRHRRAAVLRINDDPAAVGLPGPIPLIAVYHEMGDEDALRDSFQENTGLPLTVMDLAQAAVNYAAFQWDNQKIASTISTPWHKVSAARVSQLKAYIRLPYRVQSLLHRGTIPESCARAMLTIGLDGAAMEEMAGQIERGEMRPGEVVALAGKKQREKGRKARRSIKDVRELCERVGTDKAMDMLSWLDGEVKDDERVEEIFADQDPDDITEQERSM